MRSLLALSLVALSACGGTLYTSEGLPALAQGSTCDPGTQVSCPTPTGSSCVNEDPQNCGACGNVCSQALPAHASYACRAHQCSFQCADGYLRTATGCESAAAVAAGDSHTCAIAEGSGSLKCWGGNDAGQVTGSATPGSPVLAPYDLVPSGVSAVAAGARHTCAVVSGITRCWPSGAEAGMPGDLVDVGALAAGAGYTCAIDHAATTRNVRCWGAGPAAADPGIAGALSLAAGASHACALLASGGVTCWGDNAAGQLGNASLSGTTGSPFASGVVSIAAGGNHTCAARASPVEVGNVSDAVQCWGDAPGTPFLLGATQQTPGVPMKDANQSTIRFPVSALVAGRSHTCVTAPAEGLNCFGPDNALGQLGGLPIGAPTERVTVTADTAVLAAGRDHACARNAIDATLRCWGANESGQLGSGNTSQPTAGTIVPVSGR